MATSVRRQRQMRPAHVELSRLRAPEHPRLLEATRRLLGGACLSVLLSGMTACAHRSAPPTILLFDGVGTSPNDVAAVERILKQSNLSFATASSRQLNAMSLSQLRAYRLFIVPGGNFEQIGNGLTART